MSFLASQFENKEVAGGELGGLVTTLAVLLKFGENRSNNIIYRWWLQQQIMLYTIRIALNDMTSFGATYGL